MKRYKIKETLRMFEDDDRYFKGINAKQSGHYMSVHCHLHAEKQQEFIEGIHSIGKELISVI